ncbi:hypothetical protein R1flu_003202 [Riccia fluitans]|uniref:FCP1 homology domain-containing protein n=1 Tax=Riccia fluitans TaxID=41844 RepID=A0ABD1YBR6_9MARC
MPPKFSTSPQRASRLEAWGFWLKMKMSCRLYKTFYAPTACAGIDKMVATSKKLLVLDVNGLLLDTYFQAEQLPERPHDAKVNRFYVYKRNGCEDFVQFCLENFTVGVWSSAREHNVHSLVEFMFKESMEKLAFIWHQEHCTDTKLKHPENKYKPVFLKELSKLWDKCDPALPWEKGDFGPSNTVLIDDSPYKALRNPPHTGIFPKSYKATDPEDSYLVEELRKYLEGLVHATDVQVYISQNAIGVPSLAHGDEHFEFFSSARVTAEIPVDDESLPAPSKQEEKVVTVTNTSSGDTLVALPDSDAFAASHRRRGKTKFGSTVEESLEYRAADHVQSTLDFAERLSRAVDASGDVARERNPSGDIDPAVAEGVQGKSVSRGASYERDTDRHHRRGDGHRDGGDARHSPRSRKHIPGTSADRHWSEAGRESHHVSKRRNINGNQWIDSQAQYPRDVYTADTAMPGRRSGNGERQERVRDWDPLVVDNRHQVPRGNYTGWSRPGHSPLPTIYRDSSSRGLGLSRAVNHLEDHIKIGWTGGSRSSPGRHTDHKGELGNKSVDRGRPRDRDSVYVKSLKHPHLPLRGGPRADEGFNSGRSVREHEVARRGWAREHADLDRSYARPSFSRDDGYRRGRSADVVHDWASEGGRGKPRHHGEVERGHRRQSHFSHDSRGEGGSGSGYSEYDAIRRSNNVPRLYDESSGDKSKRDRPRTWGGVAVFDSGRRELHMRRDDPIAAGISGRMSGTEVVANVQYQRQVFTSILNFDSGQPHTRRRVLMSQWCVETFLATRDSDKGLRKARSLQTGLEFTQSQSLDCCYTTPTKHPYLPDRSSEVWILVHLS